MRGLIVNCAATASNFPMAKDPVAGGQTAGSPHACAEGKRTKHGHWEFGGASDRFGDPVR
jgi:hypothetical protein